MPRQIIENGLNDNILEIQKEAIDLIVKSYTREAGVRQLERNIGAVCRRVAVLFTKHKKQDE